MPRSSPPKHRHDGTSPLPLGMDSSPPPKKWDGRNTIWPHDSRTGWSYCVMIPSWKVETGSGESNVTLLNPIIFYRIKVGIQSPEGISTSHEIFHRFSDFLKLFSSLKRAFPKKDVPPAPPKHSLLRINSSRVLLEERRRALEEWIGKLLPDIDLSRSAPIATFLELEAAARSSFEEANELTFDASTSGDAQSNIPRRSSSSASTECSTIASKSQSLSSDVANDIAFGEISNGIFEVVAMLDQPEDILNTISPQRNENTYSEGDQSYINSSKQMLRDIADSTASPNLDKLSYHFRRLSTDSIGSEASSIRASEPSVSGVTNLVWDGSIDLSGGVFLPALEAPSNSKPMLANDVQIVIPFDQRKKLNRALLTMNRRLATARIDMDDIIARLNQEMTVKEYLAMKVKDLEAELEVTRQKNKENLQQAILLERERFTQTQWDMDELRRKFFELESKLKLELSEKTPAKSENTAEVNEKDILCQELTAKQEQIINLERHIEQLELKSKTDIRVLVKEVKFLRNTQKELKEMLSQSVDEKNDLERVAQNKKQRSALSKSRSNKLLHECEILRNQLQECSVNFLSAEEDHFIVSPLSLTDALELLATSDSRIGLLLAEAQLLAQENEEDVKLDMLKLQPLGSSEDAVDIINNNDGDDDGMRKLLIESLVDNAKLRKKTNSVFRCALKAMLELGKDGGDKLLSEKTTLNRFLRR